MKEPFQKDAPFLADLAAAPLASSEFQLWWLGQSGFLLQWRGNRLLLDPYLSDSLTEKYAATDKPHVRLTARVIAPEQLEGILAVTASHVHTDHLDPQTLQPLAAVNPGLRLICPESIRAVASDRSGLEGERIVGLDASDPTFASTGSIPASTRVGPFEVTAVPAAHERLDRDRHGHLIAVGWVIRFGSWVVYHSGDTLRYPGMEELLRGHPIDLALLPINGRRPERRVSGNLWGREAAHLARDINARCVIPCHYDLFEFNTESPDEFIAECHRLNQPFRVLRNGEGWSSRDLGFLP